MVLGTSVF